MKKLDLYSIGTHYDISDVLLLAYICLDLAFKSAHLLFNVYMDNISLHLHRQSIGGSVGGTVVNHMLHARDIVFVCSLCEGVAQTFRHTSHVRQ